MKIKRIKSQFTNSDGSTSFISYEDTDTFDSLNLNRIKQVYAICFLKDKIVIAYHKKNKTWGLVGGSVEKGESLEDCLKREVREESNMKVLDFKPVGYQEVTTGDKTIYQLRYVCNVKPRGKFESDPDGKITEIKIIDPKDYKQYFDWGEVGDAIIKRALEIIKLANNF
ncbi:MAG: NUDIX domain-containing protein [Candidatus Pacebacteria bacterium]|nr:NUDIX domain-containing protein [Candidatus Paceibacterota bacterium]